MNKLMSPPTTPGNKLATLSKIFDELDEAIAAQTQSIGRDQPPNERAAGTIADLLEKISGMLPLPAELHPRLLESRQKHAMLRLKLLAGKEDLQQSLGKIRNGRRVARYRNA